jgi:hypothetical protein
MDWNNEQSIIVLFDQNINQPFILPSFSDTPLLPGQSRITHFRFKKTNFQILTPCNNRQLFQIHYKIHHGFTFNEENIIKNAMEIIDNRLFKSKILQNMYNISGKSGEFLGRGVWSRSQLENDNHYRGPYDLLCFQLMCLKMKGEKGQFPTIHIYPMYKENNTQGEGTVGCVSCIYHGSTFSIEGEFEIKLNRFNLNKSNENVRNIVYWSGVIVHEMLHNLGHRHGDNDYSNKWQINIFQNCFIYNGKYYL